MKEIIGDISVSRETIANLEVFVDLTTKWTTKINLIAKGTVDDIWTRHITDSAQIYKYAPASYEKWVDLGSGGGFPGIVLAIIARDKHPNAEFVLIESDLRKSTFLRTAARELDLHVTVHANRISDVPNQSADVVSARALTALSGLLKMASQHMVPDGLCLLHKGKQAAREIAEARKDWTFQLEDHPSITDPEAHLLAIQRITARDK